MPEPKSHPTSFMRSTNSFVKPCAALQASCNTELKRRMDNKSSEDEADSNASSLIDSLKFASSIESRGRQDRAGAGGRSEKGDDAEETGPGGGRGRSEGEPGGGRTGAGEGGTEGNGREGRRETQAEMGGKWEGGKEGNAGGNGREMGGREGGKHRQEGGRGREMRAGWGV
ncbi:hypothetical protein ACLOJK_007660 [Asimina triloba]